MKIDASAHRVLAVLARGSKPGAALTEALGMSRGLVYLLIKQLETAKLIDHEPLPGTFGDLPIRRRYFLTEAGRELQKGGVPPRDGAYSAWRARRAQRMHHLD